MKKISQPLLCVYITNQKSKLMNYVSISNKFHNATIGLEQGIFP